MKTLDSASFELGANKETAKEILTGIRKDISEREKAILNNLKSVEKNNEVPEGYVIYCFYDSLGNGFEAGLTPSGYSITC